MEKPDDLSEVINHFKTLSEEGQKQAVDKIRAVMIANSVIKKPHFYPGNAGIEACENVVNAVEKIKDHFAEYAKKHTPVINPKTKALADKIVKEMQDHGLTPDDMLRIIAMARERLNELNNPKPET